MRFRLMGLSVLLLLAGCWKSDANVVKNASQDAQSSAAVSETLLVPVDASSSSEL